MGNNPNAGFQSAEGETRESAINNLRERVRNQGGTMHCDKYNICYVMDANGIRFRVHLTQLATGDGRPYYSATLGVTL